MDTRSLLSAPKGPEGLRTALQSTSVRGGIRSALEGMLDDPRLLGPCRLRRTKLKPGDKLTAWFDATVGSERSVRPVAVAWGGRVGEPSSADADAEVEARTRGMAWPFRTLTVRLAAPTMRVDVSPLDAAFPGLLAMSDPRHSAAVIGLRTPPQITALRYRPGQRHVLRYRFTEGTAPTMFVKLYPDDRARRHARTAAAVADWLDDASDAGAAPRPVAYLAAEQAVVFAQVPGRPLSLHLRAEDATTRAALERTGTALRRIHDADPAAFGPLPGRSIDAELDEVARAATAITHLAPAVGALVGDVVARTRELLAALPPEPDGVCHGDFKADHLLVRGRSLTVLDFDKVAVGDRAFDLAKVLADLRWWLAGRPAAVAGAQARVLEGYGSSPAVRLARARALEPLFMVKLTARRVQVHQRDWLARTAGPVQHADRLLRDLARA